VDNRNTQANAERKERLKQIIRDLHQGVSVDELKERFRELLQQVGAQDIMEIESQLIAEGIPEAEVKRLCDVHVALFEESLEQQVTVETEPKSPVDIMRRENEAVSAVVDDLHKSLSETDWAAMGEAFDKLTEIEKHYVRLENQLFPLLEEKGVEGPPRVLWALHDDIRAALKDMGKAIAERDSKAALEKGPDLLKQISDMIYREENILFPTALNVLDAEDWARMKYGEQEIGFTLVTPPANYFDGVGESTQEPVRAQDRSEELIDLDVGQLTKEQISLLLAHLPFDITFVDEDDRVRFYSESDRVFPRSPGIIGRTVQNCHPPDSVHVVQRIISEFRKGSHDVAEFWLEYEGRFIHIRYFAVRDAAGEYRGVLETVQDATDVRQLEGQRRLLDW